MFPSDVGIIVFAAAFGFASGGFISLGPSCVVELAGSLDGIGFKMGGFCFAIALGYVNRRRSPCPSLQNHFRES
jgi:hypothetical protein